MCFVVKLCYFLAQVCVRASVSLYWAHVSLLMRMLVFSRSYLCVFSCVIFWYHCDAGSMGVEIIQRG
jgi:hypothetical protein